MKEPSLPGSAEIHKEHQASQERLVYFLLAASGAAVAFATQRTEGQTLSWWLLPLGLAVLSWAASFYFGCKAVTWSHTTMRREIFLLQATERKATVEGKGLAEGMISAHIKSVDEAISRWSRFYHWQFRYLVIGGVLYCLWRVAELARALPCNM